MKREHAADDMKTVRGKTTTLDPSTLTPANERHRSLPRPSLHLPGWSHDVT